jgi:hypothetical protein
MSLSQPIMSVLCEFESAFSQPTWSKVQVLIIGTLLARGRRTVTAALRQMGLHGASHFALYHHVLNRARWSALELSRRVVLLSVRTFVAVGGELTFVIDETLERRWGRRINKRGHYRDPLASSKQRSVATSGLRWMVLTLVITPPWTQRPWVKGERLPTLVQVLKGTQTPWQRIRVRWYNGRRRELDVTSGTAVWYRIGQPVLPIRWVLVRDPKGRLGPRAYFSTCTSDRPRAVVRQFIKRWTIETTFEESRTHLGLETQRQWSDRAIERTMPCLFGLYSVVTLLAHALHPDGKGPVQRAAWYPKAHATFADGLAVVRGHLWGNFSYSTSEHAPDLVGIPKAELSRLIQAVCYAH